jgi:hypothetical protein
MAARSADDSARYRPEAEKRLQYGVWLRKFWQSVSQSNAFLFACLVSLYLWPVDRDPGVNVYAHLDQAAAVVVDGTLAIDRFASRPESITIDWSRAPDGRLYPAKAPGAGLAAVPAFFALYHAERAAGIDPLTRQWFRRNAVAINWLLNAVIAAFAILLLVRIGEALGVGRDASRVGALAIAIGTAFYSYATIYYAHVPAASALVVSAYLLFTGEPRRTRDVAAGFFAGVAVLYDYPAALAVVSLSAAVVFSEPRRIVGFVVGGLVPAAILASYHQVAFGSPLTTPYAYQNPEFVVGDGPFLRPPSLRVLSELLIGPYRGLFIYSPVLIAGVLGAFLMGRGAVSARQQASRLRIYTGAAAGTLVLWLLLNASYSVWWGGFTSGPRFLIPAFVLFAPLIGLGLQRFPRIGFTLLLISSANYFAITAVAILVDELVTSPLTQVIYPLFVQGDFQRSNVGMFLGLDPHWSIVVPGCVMTLLLWISWGLLAASRQGKPLNKEDAMTA